MDPLWIVVTHGERAELCSSGELVSVTIRRETGELLTLTGDDVTILSASPPY